MYSHHHHAVSLKQRFVSSPSHLLPKPKPLSPSESACQSGVTKRSSGFQGRNLQHAFPALHAVQCSAVWLIANYPLTLWSDLEDQRGGGGGEKGMQTLQKLFAPLPREAEGKAGGGSVIGEMQSELTCPRRRHTSRTVAFCCCSVPLTYTKSLP